MNVLKLQWLAQLVGIFELRAQCIIVSVSLSLYYVVLVVVLYTVWLHQLTILDDSRQ